MNVSRKTNVLLAELTESYYVFFFGDISPLLQTLHLTHAYGPVVTGCENVYFLLASRWEKPII